MDIRKTYEIDAPADEVWRALTDPKAIEDWGGGPAVMAAHPGFEFSLWDGDIYGTVREVDPGRMLLEDWYGGDWDAPSLARFTLVEKPSGGTLLELVHTGVPDDDADEFDTGWDDYYLGPIKDMLERVPD